jgi:hypothetical protein
MMTCSPFAIPSGNWITRSAIARANRAGASNGAVGGADTLAV